jgi:cbb3-type cytochrome oxidase maturation protein
MESFYLITPIALILIAVAIKLFLWAVNSGQFDDLDREASRILFDDDTDALSGHGSALPSETDAVLQVKPNDKAAQ